MKCKLFIAQFTSHSTMLKAKEGLEESINNFTQTIRGFSLIGSKQSLSNNTLVITIFYLGVAY